MGAIAENLRAIRTRLRLNQAEMADKVGVALRTYQTYEAGLSVPGVEILVRAARLGEVSLDWLVGLGGAGLPLAPQVVIISPEEARERLESGLRLEEYLPVPLLAERAAANVPMFIDESLIEGYALVYRPWLQPDGKYCCFKVRGEAMVPVLGEGDLVAVNYARREAAELQGKIVAAHSQETGFAIRYLELEADGRHLVLFAENRLEWPPKFFEPDQLLIVGAVEWASRQLR